MVVWPPHHLGDVVQTSLSVTPAPFLSLLKTFFQMLSHVVVCVQSVGQIKMGTSDAVWKILSQGDQGVKNSRNLSFDMFLILVCINLS